MKRSIHHVESYCGALRWGPSLICPTQRRIIRVLDALQAQLEALKALQVETQAELDGMMGAVLGEVFGQGGANYQKPAGELRLAAEP